MCRLREPRPGRGVVHLFKQVTAGALYALPPCPAAIYPCRVRNGPRCSCATMRVICTLALLRMRSEHHLRVQIKSREKVFLFSCHLRCPDKTTPARQSAHIEAARFSPHTQRTWPS